MLNPDSSTLTMAEDPVGAELDNEVTTLQSQIEELKAQRKLQAATILSSYTSKAILSRLQSSQRPSIPSNEPQSDIPTDENPLVSTSSLQAAHNQENLYRACASITTFRIQDPDPNAVDGGNVLGIRIDVSNSGKFLRPYYIMLNKPWSGSQLLRIHRHTVPPCIPLPSLSECYLPSPKISGDVIKGKKQDLRCFLRALRREVVGFHNRTTIIKRFRKSFKLDEEVSEKRKRKGKEKEKVIVDISAADAEAKQIRIEWTDGRIGRAVVGERGEVLKCVVIGEEGRDYGVERRICGEGGKGRMDGVADRILEGMY